MLEFVFSLADGGNLGAGVNHTRDDIVIHMAGFSSDEFGNRNAFLAPLPADKHHLLAIDFSVRDVHALPCLKRFELRHAGVLLTDGFGALVQVALAPKLRVFKAGNLYHLQPPTKKARNQDAILLRLGTGQFDQTKLNPILD